MDHGEPSQKRKYGELATREDTALLNAVSTYVELRQRVYRAEDASSTLLVKNQQLEKQVIEQANTIRDQEQKIEIGAEAYKNIIQEQIGKLQKVTDENLKLVEKSKDLVIQLTSLTDTNQSLKEMGDEMEKKDLVIAQKEKEIEQLEKTLYDKDFQLKESLAQIEAIKSQHQKIEIDANQYKKVIQEQKDNLQKATDDNLKLVIQVNLLTATNQSYTLRLKDKENEISQKRNEIMEQLLPLWKNLHKIEQKNSDKDFQLKEALAEVEAIKSQQQNIAEPYKNIIQKQKHDFEKVTDENLKLVEKCKNLVIQLNSLADTNQSYVLQWKEKEKEMEKTELVLKEAHKHKETTEQVWPPWKTLNKIEKKYSTEQVWSPWNTLNKIEKENSTEQVWRPWKTLDKIEKKNSTEQGWPPWKTLNKIEKNNSDKDFQLKEALVEVEANKTQLQKSNDGRKAAILERDAIKSQLPKKHDSQR